jgi:crotonobetainyl-CoA:carnitine CoA-transferase CaiB-like acyl-CoA transferase
VPQPQRVGGSAQTVRVPIKMSGTPPEIRRGAPGLGEHTREILADVGMDDSAIEALVASGAVGTIDKETS